MIGAPVQGGLSAASPEELVLWLLVAGHLLGDFLLQTDRMVERKDTAGGLLAHTATVVATHLAALAPVLSLALGGVVLGVGLAHAAIDRAKVVWSRSRPGTLGLFLADQTAHLLVLIGATAAVLAWLDVPLHVTLDQARAWTAWAMVAGVFAFNWTGGSAVVSGTLAIVSPDLAEEDRGGPDQEGVPGSGELIGILERFITLVLIVLGEWAAIGLLLTAKSIARFEALKKRHFAEYYLIGTLASLLVAIASGLLLGVVL